MGLQRSGEFVTDNLNAVQLHLGIQPYYDEPGEDPPLLHDKGPGQNLEVKACLDNRSLRLLPAGVVTQELNALCGHRTAVSSSR